MNGPEHRRMRELLGSYALGHLDGLELIALQAHLDGCAECRAEVAQLSPLAGPLRAISVEHLDERPVPPAGLADSILAKIHAEQSAIDDDVAIRGPWRPARWVTGLAAAVCVLVVGVGTGLFGYGLAPEPPAIPLEAVAIADEVPGVVATAGVVPHTWGMEIKLTASGFDAGTVYRVVVIGADGRRVSAGSFIGTGDKEMVCNLNSSVLRADAESFVVLDGADDTVLRSDLPA